MPERSRDWLRQAEHDLDKARLDCQWSYFEWACFYPNGLPAGVPHDYFSEGDATKAVEAAEAIIDWGTRHVSRG